MVPLQKKNHDSLPARGGAEVALGIFKTSQARACVHSAKVVSCFTRKI